MEETPKNKPNDWKEDLKEIRKNVHTKEIEEQEIKDAIMKGGLNVLERQSGKILKLSGALNDRTTQIHKEGVSRISSELKKLLRRENLTEKEITRIDELEGYLQNEIESLEIQIEKKEKQKRLSKKGKTDTVSISNTTGGNEKTGGGVIKDEIFATKETASHSKKEKTEVESEELRVLTSEKDRYTENIERLQRRLRTIRIAEGLDEELGQEMFAAREGLRQTNEVIERYSARDTEGEVGEEMPKAAEIHRAETPFDRAMSRLDAEDPERADRIRRTVGLEVARHPAGEEFSNAVREHYEREQRRSRSSRVGSWIKERLKGLVTFGWWETRQAEKFRVGTQEVAEDVEAQARLVRQEEGLLTEEEALAEAESMRDRFATAGLESPTAREYEILSEIVTHEKIIANRQIEDEIVRDALHQLEERLRNNSRVQEYISYSGEQVITAERMRDVENRIRGTVCRLRRGQAMDDIVNYKGMIREALDPEWYKRYVATGVEMVLGAVALKWVIAKAFVGGAEIVTKGAVEVTRGMKGTIWDTTREFLTENGISSPTNKQILEASKMVAKDNGIGVSEWNILSTPVDTNMLNGHLLKFGRVAASIARIVAL